MAETTVAELRGAIAEEYAGYIAELRQAEANWETKPAAGEGEEAWCARQVAEHVAGASGLFGATIAKALEAPGPGRQGGAYATAAEAVAGTVRAHDALMGVAQGITDEQLAMEFEFGPMGKANLARVLELAAHHLNDHAGQLRRLREER